RDAARDHERVVVLGTDLLHGPVDRKPVALVAVLDGLDLARLRGDELHLGAGVLRYLPRLGELDLLDAVGREERDPLPAQLLFHRTLPSTVSFGDPRRPTRPRVRGNRPQSSARS